MNTAVAALRFFFTKTCNRPEMARHLTIVRQPQKLPVVLSAAEVARLIEAAPGPKYKAALAVAYGAGLRVSEVANLRPYSVYGNRGNPAEILCVPRYRTGIMPPRHIPRVRTRDKTSRR
jgi:integrase/recombinase XerD